MPADSRRGAPTGSFGREWAEFGAERARLVQESFGKRTEPEPDAEGEEGGDSEDSDGTAPEWREAGPRSRASSVASGPGAIADAVRGLARLFEG